MQLLARVSDLLADIPEMSYFWDSLTPEYTIFFKIYNAGHSNFMGNDINRG
jgi:hypothetical protein